MSCKTFNLKSCEIQGATYQGRKIDFVNKVITQDAFTAKVYDEQGYLLTEIIGLKSGSVVYFPFTAIQNLSKDKYRIKYWADFYLLGTILLGEEELTIGNTCPNCEVDDSTLPFVLELGTETIDFTLQLVYIAIGNGGGEVDLSEYLKRVDADELYALKNHTHSYNDLTDLPPNQNIDSVVTIGAVTATTNNVNLALHFSGVNRVYIDGENYYKVTEDNFSFTPVTTGIKVLLIYALPDSQIFYLAEGVESAQAVEPTGLPTNALLVARLIASSIGTTITIPTEGFQLKANEAWVNLAFNDVGATVQTVSVHHAALRFNIISSATNIKIGGFRFYASQFLYDGLPITLRNDTAGSLEITTIAGIGIISIDADGLPIILQRFESIDLAYHLVDGVFYALNSGGEVFDPTSLENAIALKVDKPTTDGTWLYRKAGAVYSWVTAKASEVENDSTVTGATVKDALETLKSDGKIEKVIIILSPPDEDLADNVSRFGMGVVTFPFQVLDFKTSVTTAPTGSSITTYLRKNGTTVTSIHSVIPASSNTSNTTPTYTSDTYAIGDRLSFFTPTGGIGSSIKGQNLVGTLTIKLL